MKKGPGSGPFFIVYYLHPAVCSVDLRFAHPTAASGGPPAHNAAGGIGPGAYSRMLKGYYFISDKIKDIFYQRKLLNG